MQTQNEKDTLLCTFEHCKEPQIFECEFCEKHEPREYAVITEITQKAEYRVWASSESEAKEKFPLCDNWILEEDEVVDTIEEVK